MTARVLIADDDARLRRALEIRLKAEGFEVIVAQDAYQALDFAKRNPPDVMLLDINMPAGDGFSVKERIANIPELSRIPVVYITGEPPENVDRKALRMGARAVIHKPFEANDVIDTVHSILSGGGGLRYRSNETAA